MLSCVAIAAAYWFLYHQPLERELVSLGLERQRTTQQIVDILNFKNEYGSLEDCMLELDEQFRDAERALPQQFFQGEFINYIQSTAIEKGVRLISLTPGTVESAADQSLPLVRLPLRIKIECDYFRLLDFLKALEESERFINIESFTATSRDDRLDCELNVILFALDEEEDINHDAEISDGGRVARFAIDGDH